LRSGPEIITCRARHRDAITAPAAATDGIEPDRNLSLGDGIGRRLGDDPAPR
jgi:hypothetical protein